MKRVNKDMIEMSNYGSWQAGNACRRILQMVVKQPGPQRIISRMRFEQY
jgi:hypothetical protein